MRTICRQLTVGLLLASYLLATVGSFLHRSHVCSSHGGTGDLLAAGCRASCDHQVHQQCGDAACGEAEQPRGWYAGEPRPEHRHQSDQCLLCRFLVTAKSIVFAPEPTTVTECLSRHVAVVLPALRAVELLATPDCRAPPRPA